MRRILIVDDDPVSRQLIKGAIDGRDAKISVAASGAEALEMMIWSRYDLIVTDLVMDGIDGWEVIRQARKFQKSSKVLALSAGTPKRLPAGAALERAAKMGADSTLSKPFNPVDLEIEVWSLLAA